MEHQPLTGLLTTHDVIALTRLSRTSIYRMTRQGRFPPPCALGKGQIRWREADIRAWMAELPAQGHPAGTIRSAPARNKRHEP